MKNFWRQVFPVLDWASRYTTQDFRSDAIAALVVLFITVPQSIAYAFLAGLPAAAGLYAAIGGLFFYAVFGSSRALAVGPTAIIAMMTLEAVSAMAEVGSLDYVNVSLKLAMVCGIILIILRLVNFGSVISFLSHGVITGFITAAAVLIVTNQIPAILGLGSARGTDVLTVVEHIYQSLDTANTVTLMLSLLAMLMMWCSRNYLEKLLVNVGMSTTLASSFAKSAPMYAVITGVILVILMNLEQSAGVTVVGVIPTELPRLSSLIISLQDFTTLFPSALLIAMVAFMESTSIGTAIASKTRQKINPNQELVGIGFANIGSSFLGGFPVAGSFARSIVNSSSGAISPMASLLTALLVLVTLLWFAPLFYYLPKGILAAIIVMSAAQLIDVHAVRKIFQFNVIDSFTFSVTFLSVLSMGVESGILAGIIVSFVLLIRSSSLPHIAVVGRVEGSEHFRNVERYEVKTSPKVLAVRIDESLYFVNTRFIENYLLSKIADSSEIQHVLLICSAANFIDTSGLEMLEELSENLYEVGVTLHLAEVKGPVMDKLKETDFYKNMKGNVYFTTNLAMKELADI